MSTALSGDKIPPWNTALARGYPRAIGTPLRYDEIELYGILLEDGDKAEQALRMREEYEYEIDGLCNEASPKPFSSCLYLSRHINGYGVPGYRASPLGSYPIEPGCGQLLRPATLDSAVYSRLWI